MEFPKILRTLDYLKSFKDLLNLHGTFYFLLYTPQRIIASNFDEAFKRTIFDRPYSKTLSNRNRLT